MLCFMHVFRTKVAIALGDALRAMDVNSALSRALPVLSLVCCASGVYFVILQNVDQGY